MQPPNLDHARLRPHLRPGTIALELEPAPPTTGNPRTRATAAGDPRKLRGIPVTGQGGAIPGTRPGTGGTHDPDSRDTT